jgi:Calcineurin-like phosphoesterase
MPDLIASIFHLTDMHLLVDESGQTRDDPLRRSRLLVALARKAPFSGVRGVCSGSMWHERKALLALSEALPVLLAREREEIEEGTPVIALQTGDVEALGSAAPADIEDHDAFPSFAFVQNSLRLQAGADSWLDLYGNHDTWPGAYPPMRWRHAAINRARIASIPDLHGPWPELAPPLAGPTGIPVLLVRLNTVSRTMLEETQATGNVSDHPPAGAPRDKVLEQLADLFEPWEGQQAVRIVLMHHPPHPFQMMAGESLTTAGLEGAQELADRLAKHHVQLVIAGHRHKLDPPLQPGPDHRPGQPPLRAPTVQLVGESPTQDAVPSSKDTTNYDGLQPRSFARYRLWSDRGTLEVQRTVFRYERDEDGFIERPEQTLFAGIPLE